MHFGRCTTAVWTLLYMHNVGQTQEVMHARQFQKADCNSYKATANADADADAFAATTASASYA